MTLYKSGEDYLKAILVLTNRNGAVRSLDVANYLNVTKPSVCRAMRLLREGEFLSMDENKRIHQQDACRIEHDLSRATFEKLKAHWEQFVPNAER